MPNEDCKTQDGETLQAGDIVCFAVVLEDGDENALMIVRECRGPRILVSDMNEVMAHKAGKLALVSTQAILSSDVLKVA